MHNVFISFHHDNDQMYKEALVEWGKKYNIFIDGSVEIGEIPEDWDSQQIRNYIRDEHLKDTSVTILLVGTETQKRKHIDWELYSSMYDGTKNHKSGILVINLPTVDCKYHTLCTQEEKQTILPNVKIGLQLQIVRSMKDVTHICRYALLTILLKKRSVFQLLTGRTLLLQRNYLYF